MVMTVIIITKTMTRIMTIIVITVGIKHFTHRCLLMLTLLL